MSATFHHLRRRIGRLGVNLTTAYRSNLILNRSFLTGNNYQPLCNKIVEPTVVRYPQVLKEKKEFAHLSNEDVQYFKSILGPARVITEDLEGYNVDWLRTVRGQSGCVLKPKTTAEVSLIVAHCYSRNLALCPQGGNTGLVGGSVPVFDEIVISTELMNTIEHVDKTSGVVTMQAGVVLEALDNHLESYGLMAPLDLGAKGSCQIGGNVSTNAGGIRLLRYGSLQANILGLEAVLPQEGGPVLDCLQVALKKDNTGYHLKHLFVGAEGTLGIVTRVALYCPPRPKSMKVAFLQTKDFANVLATYREARNSLGEILSSCEFIDAGALECVTANLGLSSPIPVQAGPGSENVFYMLIETSGSNADHDEEKLNSFLETVMANGSIENGTLATSPSKMAAVWALRERIAEALLHDGYCYKYDISLPLHAFYESVTVMRQRLGRDVIRCVGYGHLGDGNMHLNITTREYDHKVLDKIEPFLYEWTAEQKGSISAEHGLGFKKKDFIHFSKSDKAIQMMQQLKQVFDPKGILNPYKVLPHKSY